MTRTLMRPPADLDRRLKAFAFDQVPVLALSLMVGAAGWWQGLEASVAVLVVIVTSMLLGSALGAVVGATGRTPGRSRHGVALVDASTGLPLGAFRGAARGAALASIGWLTAGFGWLVLALSSASDPWRRGWHDRLLGSVSVVATPVLTTTAGSAPDPPSAALDQVVNLTAARLASGLEPPPLSAPARSAPGFRRTPVVPLPRRWQVDFDDGESYAVETRLLIGRAAAGGQVEPGWARLVSPAGSVSATHAELAARPDGALVLLDRGSTNGSWLVRGELGRQVPPRRPATLLPGDRVRFGDRWMQVATETTTQ